MNTDYSSDLSGKVAIVTGGYSGLGSAIVLELARLGASMVIAYQAHSETAAELERMVHDLGDRAVGVTAEVSSMADQKRVFAAAGTTFGRVDILVNNARSESRTTLLSTSEEQYDQVLAVNLKGAFFATQLAAQRMIEQRSGGRIINISSVHEEMPVPGNAPYCLSRGGMCMLTRTAGIELAPFGILVIGIGAGAVATALAHDSQHDPQLLAKLSRSTPLARMGQPEEIAALVGVLAGPAGGFMTATTVIADGGLMHHGLGA